jgi:DNA-binding response OmpR family regulator
VLRELLARVRAVLRRVGAPAPAERVEPSPLNPPWKVGDLVIDPAQHAVLRSGRAVPLSPKEFRLLCALATCPGTVLTRGQLIEQVWGDEFMGDDKTLEVHVRWLREKIERDPSHPRLIRTVRGAGYRFAEEGEDGAGD